MSNVQNRCYERPTQFKSHYDNKYNYNKNYSTNSSLLRDSECLALLYYLHNNDKNEQLPTHKSQS